MKRILPLIITLFGVALIFAACQRHANDVAENTCPYALMHDDVLYYYTGEAIYEKIKMRLPLLRISRPFSPSLARTSR